MEYWVGVQRLGDVQLERDTAYPPPDCERTSILIVELLARPSRLDVAGAQPDLLSRLNG